MTASDATPEVGIFAESRRAAALAGFESFRHVQSTGSTNTDLAVEARAGDGSAAVLVTDHQTAGRGRRDRTWIDDGSGQLMVSLRIPESWCAPGLVGPALAVAARSVVAADGVPAVIKWPNDLGVARTDGAFSKLAGYLGEYIDAPTPGVVVGMGLNVETAPHQGAACVRGEGGTSSRDRILAAVLSGIRPLFDDPEGVRAELVSHSATLGARVRVERTADILVGVAVGLAPGGELLVDDGDRVHTIAVGDVVHLRTTRD